MVHGTKALVVSRSKIVNPPHGDLDMSGVPIHGSASLDFIGVKYDEKLIFEDQVHGIVLHVSQRIGILRFVKLFFEDNSMLLHCYYAFALTIPEYCSPVCGSAPEYHIQRL